MATRQGRISLRIKDATKVSKAYTEYVTFDDATATLASIGAALNGVCAYVDPITDGQIMSVAFTLFHSLPSGLKGAPVAGSDVEETGLFSFNTPAPAGKGYSIDVPAIAQSILSGRSIIVDAGDGQTYVNDVTATGATFRDTDDKWAYTLDSVRSAQKTFRKSRRALKRAG